MSLAIILYEYIKFNLGGNKTMSIWVIMIGIMILSMIVSMTLKSKFNKYAKIPLDNGMS